METQHPVKLLTGDEIHLITAAREIADATDRALSAYHGLIDEISLLESQGITNASEHYRDGRYLYLVYPTAEDGSRRREYIGIDPAKQSAALARLTRFQRHQELTQRANRAAHELRSLYYSMSDVLYRLNKIGGSRSENF